MKEITPDVVERFYKYFPKYNSKECMEWKASVDKGGYGRLKVKGSMSLAHRISYQIHYGKISDKICVLHKCDNRKCVNPDHLWLGTYSDNVKDMCAKKRNVSHPGSKNFKSKLNEFKVTIIRASSLLGYNTKRLSIYFDVSTTTINRIKNNTLWTNITEC